MMCIQNSIPKEKRYKMVSKKILRKVSEKILRIYGNDRPFDNISPASAALQHGEKMVLEKTPLL